MYKTDLNTMAGTVGRSSVRGVCPVVVGVVSWSWWAKYPDAAISAVLLQGNGVPPAVTMTSMLRVGLDVSPDLFSGAELD